MERHRILRNRAANAVAAIEVDPPVGGFAKGHRIVRFGIPAAAVEGRESDAAPVNSAGLLGIAFHLYAHDHGARALDFADLAELDVFAEARNERGLHIEAREEAGAEAGQQKKDSGAVKQRA